MTCCEITAVKIFCAVVLIAFAAMAVFIITRHRQKEERDISENVSNTIYVEANKGKDDEFEMTHHQCNGGKMYFEKNLVWDLCCEKCEMKLSIPKKDIFLQAIHQVLKEQAAKVFVRYSTSFHSTDMYGKSTHAGTMSDAIAIKPVTKRFGC